MEHLPKLSLIQVFVLCICAWVLGSMIIISELKKPIPSVAGVSTTMSTPTPALSLSPTLEPITPTVAIQSTIVPSITIAATSTPASSVSPSPTGRVSTQSTDKKYCDTANDCVAVSCGCSCSGCGGFSYQEVVNKSYEGEWYDQHACEPAQMCPMVCCAPATITCENHQCTVQGGNKI